MLFIYVMEQTRGKPAVKSGEKLHFIAVFAAGLQVTFFFSLLVNSFHCNEFWT